VDIVSQATAPDGTIDYAAAIAAAGAAGYQVILGTPQAELLVGTAGDDFMYGDAGIDTIDGLDGDDCLVGGIDGSEILGRGGDDALFGGPNHDALMGGLGADSLFGGDGWDQLAGGDKFGSSPYLGPDPGDLEDGGPDVTLRGDFCSLFGSPSAVDCEGVWP
jgi:Ca2+-binding RTX toxin-like protein